MGQGEEQRPPPGPRAGGSAEPPQLNQQLTVEDDPLVIHPRQGQDGEPPETRQSLHLMIGPVRHVDDPSLNLSLGSMLATSMEMVN